MALRKAPTIYDVAREAGLSFSHAAMALRNPQRVAAKTRDHVEKVARRLGYHRHVAASILASAGGARHKHDQQVSLAFVYDDVHVLKMPSRELYLDGVQERAAQMGYGFEFLNLAERTDLRRVAKELWARGVMGVIFGPSRDTLSVAPVDWSAFALVSCGLSLASGPTRVVQSDKEEAVRMAVQHAYERGYRRLGICLYAHAPGFRDDVERLSAWLSSGFDGRYADATFLPPHIYPRKRNLEDFLRWMKEAKPDALIGFTEEEYWLLLEAGWRIPQKLTYISLVTDERKGLVAGCVEDEIAIARRAVDWCDQLIRTREFGYTKVAERIILDPVWREGKSLPPAPLPTRRKSVGPRIGGKVKKG